MNDIENFLPNSLLEKILNLILCNKFNWNYGTIVTEDKCIADDLENQQIFHMICRDNYTSPHIELFNYVFRELKADSVLRAKINLTWRREISKKIGWHVDYSPTPKNKNNVKLKTCIIYLNDNDGGTIFKYKNEEILIRCKKNTAVIFDSEIEHCGLTCSQSKNKILLNINYFPLQ
jgi:hypothetical protein